MGNSAVFQIFTKNALIWNLFQRLMEENVQAIWNLFPLLANDQSLFNTENVLPEITIWNHFLRLENVLFLMIWNLFQRLENVPAASAIWNLFRRLMGNVPLNHLNLENVLRETETIWKHFQHLANVLLQPI